MHKLRYTQGFPFKKEVSNEDSFFVALNPVSKIVVSNIVTEDGKYYLVADETITSGWLPSNYNFQIQDSEGIKEQGSLLIVKNLALATPAEAQSIWEKALSDIDAIITGRVKNATSSIHVGDKSITYSSFEELQRLRNWISAQIAEEKENEGEDAFNPNNGFTMNYVWR